MRLDDLPLGGGLMGFIVASAPPRKRTRLERLRRALRTAVFYVVFFGTLAIALLVMGLGIRDVVMFAADAMRSWL